MKKKKLMINSNPYIRLYTHHGYQHAIISTPEKVNYSREKSVATIVVKPFDKNKWIIWRDNLKYSTDESGRMDFYTDKWNIGMNAILWRKCNRYEEMEIAVNNILYSNPWAGISIFFSSSEDFKVGKETIYKVKVGYFIKDGFYLKKNTEPHVRLNYKKLPVKFKVIRADNDIKIRMCNQQGESDDYSTTIEELQICDLIGITVELADNNYYEWLFSNYLNFYYNPNAGMPIDYMVNIHKDWGVHTTDYFIDYMIYDEDAIREMGYSTLNYIKLMLKMGYYVELLVNDNINFGFSDIGGAFFHQNLIYGLDDEQQKLNILCYKSGKCYDTTIAYKDFNSDRNQIRFRKIYVYRYNPGYEKYTISKARIYQIYKEYLNSINVTFFEPQYINSEYSFGIDALKRLSSKQNDLIIRDDRISYFLFEHSKCNKDRIDYLYAKGEISKTDYLELSAYAKKSLKFSSIIKNTIIKKRLGRNINKKNLYMYMQLLVDNEIHISKKMIKIMRE